MNNNSMHTMTQASHQSAPGSSSQAAVVNNMSQHPRDMLQSERPGGMPPVPDPSTVKLMPSIAHHSGFATTPSRYEEDIDDNPHSHFLSPVHMYESWDDSDDDSDDGSFEFDAGITDFALFNDDYKRAKELNLPLSDKWNDFVEGQADALDRAVARTRSERNNIPAAPFYSGSSFSQHESLPSLTPDTSPRLADDLDYDSAEDAATTTKSYQTRIVTPESTQTASAPINIPARSKQNLGTVSESAIEDDEFEDPAAPAFLLYRHSQRTDKRRQPAKPQPAPMRPGLSAGSRTLSGKLHVWRRPSWDLFSVDEEREAEAMQDENGARTMDGTLRKKRGKAMLRE